VIGGVSVNRILIVLVAIFLTMPPLARAGEVTNRWDMTIGGYVKFDVGWADKLVGADYYAAPRDSRYYKSQEDNLYWAGGETRLNFSIRGPEAWGSAKTSAFIEGDFRGAAGSGTGQYASGSTNNYTLFTLRHAYMQMVWPNTTLLLGHTWQAWGMNPNLNVLGVNENHLLKGWIRVPQVRVTQKVSKDFSVQVAAASGSTTQLTSGGTNYWNESTTSLVPHLSAEVIYAPAASGKIGPFGMKMGLGGFVGRDKFYFEDQTGAGYSSDAVTTYAGSFWWYLPLICGKQNNKTGALSLSGSVFAGKGLGLYIAGYPGSLNGNGAYLRSGTTVSGTTINEYTEYKRLQEPMTHGGWTQATYYLTDGLFVNGTYGIQRNSLSENYKAHNPDKLEYIENYIVSLMYDVNPAIRFGLEYDRVRMQYAAPKEADSTVPVDQGRDGTLNSIRFGAYYFF
jgi:hypothetical protein